jgi:signal transduction histidine kinase/Fe-S-cluster-containing hydrogenase component 2
MTNPVVTTIPERCRVCYTCVRECPAKAIRISGGQAEIITERCIGCGNCVQVCSQQAKQVRDSRPDVRRLLASGRRVVAIVAPSFPAEFPDIPYRRLIGKIRRLGFAVVAEVAFGADLVADRYRRLLDGVGNRRYVATTCPAVVEYVERYAPHVVGSLAPVVSPMIAAARVARRVHGDDIAVVFIGPCVAKKQEGAVFGRGELDAVLTFPELRALFSEAGLDAKATVEESDFDPPMARIGGLFPVSGGLLRTADIDDDLITGEAVVVDGRATFVEAIREFESGAIDSPLLEVLACNGCIMGPAVTQRMPLFSRRRLVSRYVKDRMAGFDEARWQADMARFEELDLSRGFRPSDQRLPGPTRDELNAILARMGKVRPEDELNCGACGYETCVEHAIAIHQGLAENQMCLPWTIDRLRDTVDELNASHSELEAAQGALVQAEKMASMGQLAAGIAHEVNNPLGVVLMYAHMLADEAGRETEHGQDLALIAEQADRCKRIVSGLLNFARQNQVNRRPTSLRELVEQALRSVRRPEAIRVRIEVGSGDPVAELDRDQMAQVLTNMVANAYEAMPDGGTLTVSAALEEDRAVFRVADTGTGIPAQNMERLFTPFFTTKPMGKGTGLGLAVSYGIVKMHQGEIAVESNADPAVGATGTTFTIRVPRTGRTE